MRPVHRGTPPAAPRSAPHRKRWWPSDAAKDLKVKLAADQQARTAVHVALHGPHTCTPDPTDPWSTCHLDSTKQETA